MLINRVIHKKKKTVLLDLIQKCSLLLSTNFIESSNNILGAMFMNSIKQLNCNFNIKTELAVTEFNTHRE